MELSVYNIKGEDTGRKVSLDDNIFGIEPNEHVMYLDVKQYLANKRQGTHKSKERSEISGSTRKLGRQKGGGGARRGDINSPVLVGGARVFGPVPRDYSFKLNKKTKKLARKSALSAKIKDNEVIVLENVSFDAPKTKDFVSMMSGLKIADKKTLLILSEPNKNVYLSARNLQNAKVITSSDVNTYAILDSACLLITEGALANIENNLKD
ncbi:MAG: 50S ribosomal protein L4 [Paludibacteraceae bacterium]|mgnify:FL=1|jgi:large subunit ribosomal protein L4|nr:50S ribosomal protein L4 [Bacteroidales bacterium]MBO5131693.1 50S ribosomal protein L4 [Paludibacteraceae bacterium]MBR6659249.1 50S ribosomal protein L4 [Paludibacteraceae bacterium]